MKHTFVPLRGNPMSVPLRGKPTSVPLRGNLLDRIADAAEHLTLDKAETRRYGRHLGSAALLRPAAAGSAIVKCQ